jgi:hypothetical protein
VIEANGDSTFFMKYANLDLLTEPDSIYGSDTIRLRDGSGFVRLRDTSITNEGLMFLNTNILNTNYTYNSNTTGSTPLIINAGTGISIPRSFNQLTINNTGVIGTTASSPLFSSGGVTPNITIQNATTSQTGAITSTDWNTFNNKVGGSGTAPTLPIWTSSNTLGNSSLTYNGATYNSNNKEFFLGTANIIANEGVFTRITSNNTNFLMGTTSYPQPNLGSNNVLIGNATGISVNASSGSNTFIGSNSGTLTTSGNGNIGIGEGSLYYNTTGSRQLMIGCEYCGTQVITADMNAASKAVTTHGKLFNTNLQGSGTRMVTALSTGELSFQAIPVNTDGQTLSTSGAAGNITILGGNTININVNDADADPNNEIQSLSLGTKTGSTIPINIGGGGVGINMVQGTGMNITRDAANQFTINSTATGTLTSITANAPLTGGTITTSGSIGIQTGSGSQNGAISSTDWTTFNSKVGGSGSTNYFPIFTGASTIGNSVAFQEGTTMVIDGENRGLIVDAGGNRRFGFMKYSGLSPVFAAASGEVLSFGNTSTSSVATAGTFSERLRITPSNIRVFSLAGSGNRMVVTNSLGELSTQAIPSATGTVTSITANSPLTGGTITTSGSIGIQTGSGSQSGAISSTDWTTFNNKVGGSGVAPRVAFWNSGTTLTSDADLYWDAGTNQLGVGTIPATASVGTGIHVKGTGSSVGMWRGRILAGGDNVSFVMGEVNSQAWIGAVNASLTAWSDIYMNPSGTANVFMGVNNLAVFRNDNERLGIGTNNPQNKLHVSGGTRISDLSGTGNRMVIANSSGDLSTQAIPSGSGTVTSITANSPLTGGTITTSGSIGIQTASGSQSGAISSTDWTTFNNKIGGSGSTNYFPIFTGTSTIGNSVAFQEGTTMVIDGENRGLIVDAGGNRRFGFMKYSGLSPVIAVASGENFSIGNTSTSSVATAGTFSERIRITPSNIRVFSLAGSGNRMVVTNSLGELSSQAIPVDTDISIYNSNGSIPSSTTRIVSLPSNSTLEIGSVGSGRGTLQIANGLGATLSYGSPTQGILGVNNLGAFIQFGGAGDTYVSANSNSHVKIRTNGTTGTANQVLTANSSADAVWQNNPALDNLYNTSTGSVTFTNGGGTDAAVFGIGVSAQYCSATSTVFTKSSSSAVYEIDLVINTSSLGDQTIDLGLFQVGVGQIRSSSQTNTTGSSANTDMIFKFMTDSSSGGLSIRNIGASTFTATVKHIAIKRLR